MERRAISETIPTVEVFEMREMKAVLVVVMVALAGCPAARQNVACESSGNCDLTTGGTCIAATSGNMWCAYPDSSCTSGYRFSDVDVGDGVGGQCTEGGMGMHDAGIDVPADAGKPAFDIVYPNEWKFSVEGPISAYLLIVNKTNVPLTTSTLAVQSITDDHPVAVVRVTANPVNETISAFSAGGQLTPLSKAVLVDSGLVTEPRVNTSSNYLTLEIGNAPTGNYDIHATLVLQLDNINVTMPMLIHYVDEGGVVWADPLVGKRVMVYR